MAGLRAMKRGEVGVQAHVLVLRRDLEVVDDSLTIRMMTKVNLTNSDLDPLSIH